MEEFIIPSYMKYVLMSPDDCVFLLKNEYGKEEKVSAKKHFVFAFSEPLRQMIEGPLAIKGDISLPDVTPATFKNLLKCIYGGGEAALISLAFNELVELLELVEIYLMTDLKPKLISVINQQLSLCNVMILLASPACFQGYEEEWRDVLNWVCFNIVKILNHPDMKKIFPPSLTCILKQHNLNIDEVDLWKKVVEWGKKKLDYDQNISELTDVRLLKLRECTSEQVKYTRFGSMGVKDFLEMVVPMNILIPEDVVKVCTFFGVRRPIDSKTLCSITKPRSTILGITKFSFIIHDINSLQPESKSKVTENFEVCNFSWYLSYERRGTRFSVFLNSSYLTIDCEVEFKIILLNKYGKPNVTCCYSNPFGPSFPGWGTDEFCLWEKLINVNNGFVKDNSVTLVLEMLVLETKEDPVDTDEEEEDEWDIN